MTLIKRISIVICTLTLSTALLAAEPTPIGVVLSTTGAVEAIDVKGQAHTLGRRSQFYEKETIITDENSKAKLRFIDGNIVSLSPQSEFHIDEYHYDPDKASDNVYSVSLLKGAMLTVSGAIVKLNAKNYKVETSVGTIGIEGTTFYVGPETVINVSSDYNVTLTQANGDITYISSGEIAKIAKEGCQVSATVNSSTGCIANISIAKRKLTNSQIQAEIIESGTDEFTTEEVDSATAPDDSTPSDTTTDTSSDDDAATSDSESTEDVEVTEEMNSALDDSDLAEANESTQQVETQQNSTYQTSPAGVCTNR